MKTPIAFRNEWILFSKYLIALGLRGTRPGGGEGSTLLGLDVLGGGKIIPSIDEATAYVILFTSVGKQSALGAHLE